MLFSVKFVPKVNTPLNKIIDKRKKGKARDLCNLVSICLVEYPLQVLKYLELKYAEVVGLG